MLEAWEWAEKIWFPVVWETEKDASNVIDYDVHDEITKDTSSVINANNDTTTGMANVIPWVNAPKLIASTSIIWAWWWGGGTSVLSAILVPIRYFNTWQNQQLTTWIEITNEGWAWFTDNSWTVSVWKAWIYAIHIEIPYVFGSSAFYKQIRILKNWVTLLTSSTKLDETSTEDITVWLANWDEFTFYCELSTTSWASLNGNMTLLFTKQ